MPESLPRIAVAVLSTIGALAVRNEDAVGIDGMVLATQATHSLTFTLDGAVPHVFVVADGMGGRAGGQVASAIAAQQVSAASTGSDLAAGIEPGDILAASMRQARAVLDAAAAADETLQKLGTTAIALYWDPAASATVAQVGDSMAYRFVESYLGAISTPHRSTDPATLGKLTQHLGAGQLSPKQLEPVTLRVHNGARFVLCTDGVWDLASKTDAGFEELERRLALPDLAEAAAETLAHVFALGATDNATAIILEFRLEPAVTGL